MGRYLYIPIIAAIFLSSCSEAPIKENDFTDIMYEIYLVDNAVNLNNFNTRKSVDTVAIYEPVINSHGYTKQEFMDALDYYMDYPERMYDIFVNIQDKLEDEKERVTALFNAEQKLKVKWEIIEFLEIFPDSLVNSIPYLRATKWLLYPVDTAKCDQAGAAECHLHPSELWAYAGCGMASDTLHGLRDEGPEAASSGRPADSLPDSLATGTENPASESRRNGSQDSLATMTENAAYESRSNDMPDSLVKTAVPDSLSCLIDSLCYGPYGPAHAEWWSDNITIRDTVFVSNENYQFEEKKKEIEENRRKKAEIERGIFLDNANINAGMNIAAPAKDAIRTNKPATNSGPAGRASHGMQKRERANPNMNTAVQSSRQGLRKQASQKSTIVK